MQCQFGIRRGRGIKLQGITINDPAPPPMNSLATQLFEAEGIEFYGVPRRNMKNHLMRLNDKLLSRSGALRSGSPTMKAQQDKRSIIETIIDQLKNISQIEHSRHRSPVNFCTNVLCGSIANCDRSKKLSLGFEWVLPPAA